MKRKIALLLLVLIVILPSMSLAAQAQDEEIVVSFAMPGLLLDMVKDQITEGFAEQHPNIRVDFVASDGPGVYSPDVDIETYLDNFAEYAAEADVMLLSSTQLAPEITRAGYLLDLNPLIGVDSTFPQDDFYPNMLNSYRWDGGMWGLPLAGDTVTILYKADVFDRLGLAHPNAAWAIADIENAIQVLKDSEGDNAFMNLISADMLLLSLAGESVVDETVLPVIPNFDSPQLQSVLTDWVALAETGALEFSLDSLNFDSPLIIGQGLLMTTPQFGEDYTLATVPSGRSALMVTGVSVSSGTRHPEAAYELAKYLTTVPNLTGAIFGVLPARQSLVGVQGDDVFSQALSASESLQAEMVDLVANSYPLSQQFFSGYLLNASIQMQADGIDAQTALQEQEVLALQRLASADARRETTMIAVATPIPQFSGEGIVINFGIQSLLPQIANQDRWNALAEDFAANDPEVGQVNVAVASSLTGGDLNKITSEYDCFYVPNNIVPGADLSLLRSLDPLFSSDFTFDPNDFSGNVLTQVQRDNQTWALPFTIQPQNLWFNADMFNRAGAQLPTENWTVSDFETALRTLKVNDSDPTPLSARDYDNAHLLVLIAAYGGLPIDYRTDPITLNFTDPANVDAIQQVLDLAKADYIEYNSMLGAGAAAAILDPSTDVAMYIQQLNDLSLFILNMMPTDTVEYEAALLPAGTQYSPLSYDIGVGLISANTPAIEGCYRFLSYVSQESATLFDRMMPARRSLLDDVAISQGQNIADLYAQIDRRIQSPNAILIPTAMQSTGNIAASSATILPMWLNKAFDAYVLEDADLQTALEDAQTLAVAYQQCTANIPAYDPLVNNDPTSYLQQFIDCAVQVDPEMSALLGVS